MVRAVFRLRPAEVPPRPNARLRSACYALIHQPWFEPAMLGLVCCSAALMAAQYYNQPAAAAAGEPRGGWWWERGEVVGILRGWEWWVEGGCP